MSGRFLQQRSASIRSRVLLLLLAPLLPLIGIWVFSTTQTVGTATNLLDGQTMADHIGLPTSEVVFQLQKERKLSTRFAGGDAQVAGDLKAQRMQTDVSVAALKGEAGSSAVVDTAGDQAMAGIQTLIKALETLPAERAAVDTKRKSRLDILSSYDDMIDKAFTVYYSISEVIDNHEVANQASLSVSLTEAREMYSREDAILAGALAGGSFAAGERSLLVQSIGTQRHLYEAAARRLSPEDALRYAEIQKGDAYQRVHAAEDKLVEMTRNQVTGIDPTIWNADYTMLNQQLGDLESAVTRRTIAAAGPAGTAVLVRLAVAGGIGLILIAVLLFVSIRASRSILRRIASLRQHALSVADHGLPAIIAKLRAGESVDVEATAPPLPPADDELGQLDGAFALMQRTAVLAAVQEAQLRTGLNQVFLNLGRRTQTLVHRQLALLDAMERRITDPRDLEDLYRIDHLGARMRRHAEDLVILAGAVPGRGWRNPVPLHDVLRSAVSEVEEYTRITLIPLPEMALAGRAVSDVVHLLAELLENATAFSPRETNVRLSGQLVPNGFAVEIEDRGVGMPADDIHRANSRLAEPPDFDPAHSSRLGLFVVARLAARHNIRVTLKDSPYGGITAVTLLPREIIVETVDGIEEPPQLAAAPHAVAAAPAPLPGPLGVPVSSSMAPAPLVGNLVASPWNGTPPPAAPGVQEVP
ncbi:MAG: hypothetical protein HOV83_08540, partial [Catenulispora sp.]|nr:hypothetical protein [Catenulispora sp.]